MSSRDIRDKYVTMGSAVEASCFLSNTPDPGAPYYPSRYLAIAYTPFQLLISFPSFRQPLDIVFVKRSFAHAEELGALNFWAFATLMAHIDAISSFLREILSDSSGSDPADEWMNTHDRHDPVVSLSSMARGVLLHHIKGGSGQRWNREAA